MTQRERLLTITDFQKPDRWINWEWGFWKETIKRWHSEGLPDHINSSEKVKDYLNIDQNIWPPINSGYTDSPFYPPFEKKVIEEQGDYFLYQDINGIIMRQMHGKEESSMPQFIKFPVESRDDWERIKNRLNPENIIERLGNWGEVKKTYGPDRDFYISYPLCGAYGHQRNLLGVERLSLTYYDDPGLIHLIMENWLALSKAISKEVVLNLAPDYLLLWEDMCFKTGSLISKKLFKEFITPYYKELIEFLKSLGLKNIWVDTDGNCWELIPLFLETGVNGILPMEVQAGMDIIKVRNEFGDNLFISGGLDKKVLTKDKASIKKEVMQKVPYMYKTGGYIATLDHSVPPDVPFENYLYYREVLESIK